MKGNYNFLALTSNRKLDCSFSLCDNLVTVTAGVSKRVAAVKAKWNQEEHQEVSKHEENAHRNVPSHAHLLDDNSETLSPAVGTLHEEWLAVYCGLD